MYNNILSIFELIRIKNIVLSILAILFFCTSLSGYAISHLIYCIIIVVGYLIGGNILNDYYDYDIDLINKPNSPLVNKFITLSFAYKLGLFFLILSFILSLIFNKSSVLISLFTLIILFLYTTKLKKIPLIGNILISILVGLIFLFLEISLTGQLLKSWPCFILSFILNFCRELVKDMEDIKGDSINNIKTFPVVFGINYSRYLLVFLILLFIAISLLPIISNYFINIYFALLFFIHIPLFYIIILLLDDLTSEGYRRVSNLIKMIYGCGLLIILISLK